MSTRVVASIPPQPACLELNKKWSRTSPLHLSGCHDRVVYGITTGVMVRRLPGEILLSGSGQVELHGVSKRPITCATSSRNGRLVVGGDNDGQVHVWLRENAEKVVYKVYKLDDMRYVHLTDIALSEKTQRVVAVGYDKHSKVHGAIIQAQTGSRIGTVRGHAAGPAGGISSVAFSPQKPYNIVTGGFDGRLCLHSGPPYKLVSTVETGCTALTCVRFSPDGSMLAVLGTEGYMAVFDEKLTLITDADFGTVTPLSCDWQARERTTVFAAACDDNAIHVLKVDVAKQTINVLFNISTNDEVPRGILWTRTMWLIVPLESGALFGWSLQQKSRLQQLRFTTPEQSAASTDSESEGEASVDGATSHAPDIVMYGPKGGANVIHFDQASNQLLVGTNLGYIMFLDAGSIVPKAFRVSQMGNDRRIKSCLTNGDYAATVSMNGGLKFFRYVRAEYDETEAYKQQVRRCLKIVSERTPPESRDIDVELVCDVIVHSTQPLCLVFIGSRDCVGLFEQDGGLHVYNIKTGTEMWSVKMGSPPLAVSASFDGTLICVAVRTHAGYHLSELVEGAADGEVVLEVYEMLDGSSIDNLRLIKVIRTLDVKLTALSVNSNGSLIAYSSGNYIKVQETGDSETLLVDKEWGDHRTRVCDISWSLSGHRLITTSTHELFVWDLEARHRTLKLRENHSGCNLFARFIYENVIISGGAEGLLNIHELEY